MNLRSTAGVALVLAVALATAGIAGGVAADGGAADATVQADTAVQAEECTFPTTVEDRTGTEVEIGVEPDRVVTLIGDDAQTMWEIGAEEKVVGVTPQAYYLDGAEEKANVSAPGFGNYDVERIVDMEADLVLAPAQIPEGTVEQVRDAGIPVVWFEESTSIEDVIEKTETIGRLVGECEGAATTNEWVEQNLAAVESATADRDRPGAVYVIGTYTTGDETFVHDAIEAAGATNVIAEAGETGFVPVDEEVVADSDPEWLILDETDTGTEEREPYASTTAGEEDNVVRIDPNYLNQPAPRSIVYTVRNLTAAFHGDAYGEDDYVTRADVESPDPTPTPTETPTGTPTETPPDDGTPTPTDDPTEGDDPDDEESEGLPGFGVGVALVAVLTSLALLARRR